MDEQRQDDQLEPTHSSSVPIQDVVLKTCRKQWTIEKGGEKGSGISVLMVRHDDDDEVKRDTGSLLPPYKGQEVSGFKLFLGRWFVCCQHGGVTWVGKL